MNGIDVSIFNDVVDWLAVKYSGCQFAICRTGYGQNGYDESFARNVDGAHAAGLLCGAYHYSYAITPQDAKLEARHCKKIISDAGVRLELPVFFDMEDADGYKRYHNFNFSRENITDICRAFIEELKPLHCGVYASFDWLDRLIDWQSLGCPVWNAQWGNADSLQGFIWQFTDRLNIGGKFFDANILY